MMRRLLFTLVVVAGCTKADAEQDPPATPTIAAAPAPGVAGPPAPPPAPPAKPAPADVKVELTSVTLADDCGGTPPRGAPVRTAKAKSARMAIDTMDSKA